MIETDLSPDARALADLLVACPIGSVITYNQMTAAIGRDITACRHVLARARQVALREVGAAFVVEVRVGLRRMSAEEVVTTTGPVARQHIRRTARRALKTLASATKAQNDMPPEMQRRLSAEQSSMALLEHITRDRVVAPKDDAPTKPTPVAVTARALLSVITGKKENDAA